jgi:ferredoxin
MTWDHATAQNTATIDKTGLQSIIEALAKRGYRVLGPTVHDRAIVYDDIQSVRDCKMVCPTCFCTSVEETNDLTGSKRARSRPWDSCFTMDYSYVHGGGVRPTTRARYRQWMTHKLSTWWDQFGTSGCVGCGRCITWCPVGIDITEVVAAIRGRGPK